MLVGLSTSNSIMLKSKREYLYENLCKCVHLMLCAHATYLEVKVVKCLVDVKDAIAFETSPPHLKKESNI
jgi:hypothetical protein